MTMVPRSPTALVVYESMFGNTRQIAEAIAAVLSERCTVQLVAVSQAPLEVHDVDLLVVGGPTHALGMSRPSTRTGARDKGATGDVARGVREWLRGVTFVPRPALATAFDTRVRTRLTLGSARRPIVVDSDDWGCASRSRRASW